jgi:Kef-type K+ transport system membrane component KefB
MPQLDYDNLVLVTAAAMVGPLVIELLPVPKLAPIVVELLAGILIGPHVLGLVEIDEPVAVLSQIGLVFLFFLAGLEIAFDREGRGHLWLVAGGFAVSTALAVAVAHLLDAAGMVEAPLLVAIVLAATAFGIVVAVLKDAHQTTTSFGRLVIAGASVADVATVVLLSLFFSRNGSGVESALLLLGLFAILVALVGIALSRARLSVRLLMAVERLQETTAQIAVRIAFVLLVALVFLAEEFGLEVVLGAFLAGAIVSLVDRDGAVERTGLKTKVEAIGFGVFVPIFFVASGVQLELDALFESPSSAALVLAVPAALLVVRGLPALLYRHLVGPRQVVAAGLLQATSLSFIVPAAQIGVELGEISEATAAGLVTGGLVSVLVFPALAMGMLEATAS